MEHFLKHKNLKINLQGPITVIMVEGMMQWFHLRIIDCVTVFDMKNMRRRNVYPYVELRIATKNTNLIAIKPTRCLLQDLHAVILY